MKKINVYRFASIFMILSIFMNFQALAQGTEERKLPAFSELNLAISADVILIQGSTQKVEIQASEKQLKLIETEVNNGKLTIKWSQSFVTHTEGIKIYITMVDIKALRVSGSGDILTKGKINAGDVTLSISGSGNIKVDDLKAENIHSAISGSADIYLGGTSPANSLEISISGSGDFTASDLAVKNIDVAVSGSGNCRIYATESIKARISGSGDVYYRGSATIDAKVSGSGSVQHVN